MNDLETLPAHLAEMKGWVEIPGFGWLRAWPNPDGGYPGYDFLWWHHCPPMVGHPGYRSSRRIDVSTGTHHAILSGSLRGGDLTIGGGSGSIPCDKCGLHGWVRDGKWVSA